MTLRGKVTALIMGTILLSSVAMAYVLYNAQVAMIEISKNRELNIVEAMIQNTMQDRAKEALAKSSLIGNIPAVRSAFRAGNREYLIEQLQPTIVFQRDNYGLTQASFWNPPASSFLVLLDLEMPSHNLAYPLISKPYFFPLLLAMIILNDV